MNLFKNVDESWIPLLHSLAYKEPLVTFLDSLREISYQPKYNQIFKVFEMPVKDIKVVILGQEPYPRPGDAIGLAYATSEGSEETQVLSNIKQEIYLSETEVNDNLTNPFRKNLYNSLDHWVEQGVFLLNTALTVETTKAGSHTEVWKDFTDTVISYISAENPCVWVLWGHEAQKRKTLIKNLLLVEGYDKETIEEIPIDPNVNYILPGEHPIASSLGRGRFFKDGFYFTDRILEKKSLKKIIW